MPGRRHPGGAPTILVVDADTDSRVILQALLAHRGVATVATASGDAALALARSVGPALVLTELYVPAGAHPCVAHAFHADARLRTVPVVVLTTQAFAADLAWADRADVAAFLEKPAPLEAVLALVGRWCAPRAPGRTRPG